MYTPPKKVRDAVNNAIGSLTGRHTAPPQPVPDVVPANIAPSPSQVMAQVTGGWNLGGGFEVGGGRQAGPEPWMLVVGALVLILLLTRR
jgi:hypothetical protein